MQEKTKSPQRIRSVLTVWTLLVAGLAATSSSIAGDVASFHGLGDLPDGGFSSFANAVSADGAVVVGQGLSPSGVEAFQWTAGGSMIGLGVLPGVFLSVANATSADGAVVVGVSQPKGGFEAFRWTAGSGMVGLDDFLGGDLASEAFDVSADGTVVVGSGRSALGMEAFRWTAAGGMLSLGGLSGGSGFGIATGISADGTVIAGTSDSPSGTQAFRWTAGGGMVGLGDLEGGIFFSEATAISADGTVVVGNSSSSAVILREAFRWTADGGMVGLGDIAAGLGRTQAYATSADGAVVVGDSLTALGSVAFLWTPADGMRSLKDVLVTDFGLDLTGWTLAFAYGVSDDGLTIVGAGNNPNGLDEAWIATFPAPCLTDLDASGEGNLTDFALLAGCLTGPGQPIDPGCEIADTNNDGKVDLDDSAVFQAAFGCTP